MKLKRYLKNLIKPALVFLLVNILISSGCSRRPPGPLEKTDIEKKFLESFNETTKIEYPLHTSTRIAGKTFWIYIATEKDLLTINSSRGVGGVMPEKNIKFMDITCQYESSSFSLDYIFLKYTAEEKGKEKDLLKKTVGGTTLYQDFTDTTILILQKTYFSIGDILRDTEDFNFFAICLANITKGIKITFVIHRVDMEQFLMNMLPPDEFYTRMILKTDGSKEIVNDKYGLHVEYNDISLIDFLREQIVSNARAKVNELEKYSAQQLKAINKLDSIILKTVYDVTEKYEFDDFMFVEIVDLISDERLTVSKRKLISQFASPPKSYYLQDYNF